MQVTRVHAGKKNYMQVCSRLSTGAPWYLRGLSTCYNLSLVVAGVSLVPRVALAYTMYLCVT